MNSHDPRKPNSTQSAIERPLGMSVATVAAVVTMPAMQ